MYYNAAYLLARLVLQASRAPGVDDDDTEGIVVGLHWQDNSVVPPQTYICQGVATGAAVWTSVTQAATGHVNSVNLRTGAVTLLGTDIPAFVASGSSHAPGAVPDPGSSAGTVKFLREDATWATPSSVSGVASVNARTGAVVLVGTDIPAFIASGSSAAAGAVPIPSLTAGTVNFLREDATWAVPAYTTVNTRGGAVTLVGTDIPTFVMSGSSAAPGAVPAPSSTPGTVNFLREDATWAIPPGSDVVSVNTRTGAIVLVGTDIPVFVASGASHAPGTVPDPGASSGTTHFLREDATWTVPSYTTVNTRSGAVTLVGTDIPTFIASGASAAAGGVPAPSITAGTVNFLREDATWAIPAGTGTVTSVGMSVPSFLSVTGGPITASGTLAVSLAIQSENLVFAGPATGSAAAPTFRSLVTADIPNLPASQITSGQLATARGGTGVDSSAAADGDLLIGTGSGLTLATLTAGTGVSITNGSGAITITATGVTGVSSVNTRTGAVSLVGTDIPVFVASGPSAAAGAVPAPSATPGTVNYLREDGTWDVPPGGGSGSVTSVGMSVPSFLSVTPGSITTSGTFAVTLATQSANLVFAGPATGTAAAPTFRSLVAADIPWSGATAVLDGTFAIENTADTTKQFNWSLGGMTSGKELTLASIQSTSQTLTIPNIAASDTLATLGLAQTFTGNKTFAPTAGTAIAVTQAVGAEGLVIAGGTQTASFPCVDITQTWNNASTLFTGSVIDIIDTASANGSKMLDLQINGASYLVFGRKFLSASYPTIRTNGTALVLNGGNADTLYLNVDVNQPITTGTGLFTMAGGNVAMTPGSTAAEGFTSSGRIGVGFPVPYVTPITNNTTIAFDIFPKGAPSNYSANSGVAWMDICSTDIIADGTDFESLRMGKLVGSYSHVSSCAQGTGTVRDLYLQLNGGQLFVGSVGSPNLTITAAGASTFKSTITGTQLISNIATGTAPLVVTSTTNVANLNASSLNGANFAAPGAIGGTAASAITGTTITGTSVVTPIISTTANLTVTDTTNTWNPIVYTAGAVSAGVLTFAGTKDASSSTVAGVVLSGGLAVAKSVQVGTSITAGTSVLTGSRLISYGSLTTFNGGSGYTAVFRSGGTITPNTGDMVIQSDPGGNNGIYFVNGSTPVIVGQVTGGTLATSVWTIPGTTSASSATTGAFVVGNGTAATSVAIGGGQINAGGAVTVQGTLSTASIAMSGSLNLSAAISAYGSNGNTSIVRGNSGAFATNSLVFQSGGTTTAGGGFYWGLNNGTSTSTVMELNSNGLTVSNLTSGDIVYATTGGLLTTTAPGLLSATIGGTGVNGGSAANGTLLIGNGTGYTLATLTAGSNITITNASGGITIAASGGGGGVSSVNTRTGAVTLVATDIPVFIASGASHAVGTVPDPGSSSGTTRFLREDATWVVPGGSGTVTSVGVSVPSFLSVTPGTITSSGTFAISLATQSENLVFAGPATGAAAAPTFRSLVAADLPVFVASGSSHAAGAVPDPGATAGITRFLREDASFDVPPVFTGDAGAYSFISGTQIFLPCNDNPATVVTNLVGAMTFIPVSISSVAGKFGQAYGFNGTTSYIESSSGNLPGQAIGSSYTIAFWVQTTSTNPIILFRSCLGVTPGPGEIIVSMNQSDGGAGTVSVCTTNGSIFSPSSDLGGFYTTATNINNGGWHFIVIEKIASSNWQFYVDNVADKSIAIGSEQVIASDNVLYLGTNENVNEFLDGAMDEVQYYNTQLTTGQINTLYTLGLAGLATPAVVGYVPAPTTGYGALGYVLTAAGTWQSQNQLAAQYSSISATILATTAYAEYTGGGGAVFTLPAAASVTGFSLGITIKNHSTGSLTIAALSGDTIEDGVSGTMPLTAGQSVYLVANQVSEWSMN